MKNGAIFDMDGLLFDTERLYYKSMEESTRRFGVQHTQEFEDALAGTNGAQAVATIHSFFPAVDAHAMLADCTARVRAWLEKEVPLKPGARELPAFFRAHGVRTAVASSTEKDLVLHNLKLAGLDGLFDAVVSGQEVAHGKPAPDVFLHAAQQIGCAPEECYVFEDSVSGCRAGIAAGCATVMVIDMFQPTEELRTGCARICESLFDVQRAIEAGEL